MSRPLALMLTLLLIGGMGMASNEAASLLNPNVQQDGREMRTVTGPRPDGLPRQPLPLQGPRLGDAKILIAFSDYDDGADELRDGLRDLGHEVDIVSTRNSIPTLETMLEYDAVITWTNYTYSNSTLMGDRLADYADEGGRPIISMFAWASGWHLQGRITTEAPYQLMAAGSYGYQYQQSTYLDDGHPITTDLDVIGAYWRGFGSTYSQATVLGTWPSYNFVLLSENELVVGINMHPGSWWGSDGPWFQLFSQAADFGSGPGFDHDMRLARINAPTGVNLPGTLVTPSARIRNVGELPQTDIPVHAWIDDPSDNRVYEDELTYEGTLEPGDTVSVFFKDWTVEKELSYTITMFTDLDNDEQRKNDTARTVIATIGWQEMPKPGDEQHRITHATVWDADEDMLYMFGGNAAGWMGTNLASLHRYDPEFDEWTKMASAATPAGWLSAGYVDGKIIALGGLSNSNSAMNNTQLYDVASNTWSSGTNIPRGILAYGLGVYDERLVYLMGGYNMSSGTADVDIYDPAANSWMKGTALPYNSDMYSATIVGDTIYIAQSYNRSAGQCWANLYKGAINPGNPAEITWIQGPALDEPVFNGGTAAIDEYVYWMGGYVRAQFPAVNKMWRYNIDTGIVDHWGLVDYPKTLSRVDYMVARDGAGTGLYVLAGDEAGNWGEPNNFYYKMMLPSKDNDYGIALITNPANAQLEPGTTIAPAAYVKNYGNMDQVDVDVRLRISDTDNNELYNEVILVSLTAGDSMEFAWPEIEIPNELFIGRVFQFETELADDQRPRNNAKALRAMTLSDMVYCYPRAQEPDINGYFDEEEWADAYGFDCSNIFGWAGPVRGPGAAFAYFKNDERYLYVAIRLPEAETRDIGDQVLLYIDVNGDGQWATDMSEGDYRIWINEADADQVQYRWHSPTGQGTYGAVPGAMSSSGVFNGYLVIEARIPIGRMPYQLNIDPESQEMGLFLVAIDDGGRHGWFRAGLPVEEMRNPAEYGQLIIQTLQTGDVGVTEIVQPPARWRPDESFTPEAKWKNFEGDPMAFTAFFFITDPNGDRVYAESQDGMLEAGQELSFAFPAYTPTVEGDWMLKCSTAAGGDINPANDVLERGLVVASAPLWPAGWVEVLSQPGAAVRRGGGLALGSAYSNEEVPVVYASKGNKMQDFYQYHPYEDVWVAMTPIPSPGRPLERGFRMAFTPAGTDAGHGRGYAVYGNNTLAFYAYDPPEAGSDAAGIWTPLADVPAAPSGRRVRGGGDVVYVDGFIYSFKADRNDFHRFDIANNSWDPPLLSPPAPRFRRDSFLVPDGNGGIYLHQARDHGFWRYDIAENTWAALPAGMPMVGDHGGRPRSKKARDGSSADMGENGMIYALKGGNTTMFYSYDIEAGTWAELPGLPRPGSSPRQRRVGQGADIVHFGFNAFFALKGNRTTEFWRYVVPGTVMAEQRPERSGVMAGDGATASFVKVGPNPLTGANATLRYSLPKAGPATVNVFDVSGRNVLSRGVMASRAGAVSLDLRSLSAGIYLVKVEAEGFSGTQKLVVQR